MVLVSPWVPPALTEHSAPRPLCAAQRQGSLLSCGRVSVSDSALPWWARRWFPGPSTRCDEERGSHQDTVPREDVGKVRGVLLCYSVECMNDAFHTNQK